MSILDSSKLEWIINEAKCLGFLDGRAVALENDPNFPAYLNWIQQEQHQPLHYLSKHLEIRENPKKLGDNLKTAIVFLHPYPKSFSSQWIAKYAGGKDYHITLKQKLKSLDQLFQDHFDPLQESRICVDTAPLLERSLAERSGLGWIGKNGCLISRQFGSYHLIASWLISLEYPYESQKGSFHCGKCTRCLDACPTDAFIQPGFINVVDCLSTQTIENRDLIDPKYHPHLQTQSFGCDICMDICPWNRKHLLPNEKEHLPPLKKLLALPESQFRDYFRKTALVRPGWHGLRRNFLISAAWDSNVPKSVFIQHLEHPSLLVQRTAQQIIQAWPSYRPPQA